MEVGLVVTRVKRRDVAQGVVHFELIDGDSKPVRLLCKPRSRVVVMAHQLSGLATILALLKHCQLGG